MIKKYSLGISVFFICVLPVLGDAIRPSDEEILGRLTHKLEAILLRGEIDERLREDPRYKVLKNKQRGFVNDYAVWSEYNIGYNRKLERAQNYKPIPLVRELKEKVLQTPKRGGAWVKGMYSGESSLARVWRQVGELQKLYFKSEAEIATKKVSKLEEFVEEFFEASLHVKEKAWDDLSLDHRSLLQFVLPWICRIDGHFYPHSKGSPIYTMDWIFDSDDPFRPGRRETLEFKEPIPDEIFSMTGVYHYLRALSGQPVFSRGVYRDRRSHDHPIFHRSVDYKEMHRAYVRLASLLNEGNLERVFSSLVSRQHKKIKVPGVEGLVVEWIKTPHGSVVIGGSEKNVYTNVDADMILDLGGEDEYHFDSNKLWLGDKPIHVIIDFDGDDLYTCQGVGGPGAGIMNIGVLIDKGGNDIYAQGLAKRKAVYWKKEKFLEADTEGKGTRIVPPVKLFAGPGNPEQTGVELNAGFAFGAAFLGVGCLVDQGGDDRYLGQKFAFGAAMCRGVAQLSDFDGDDIYATGYASIGVGVNHAVGVVDDTHGDDHYQCLGIIENSYSFGEKWDNGYGSSGIGFGSCWRAEARSSKRKKRWQATFAGGLGLVHDTSGNDSYIGSLFSIASGYAGGVGMVVDDDGDDIYFVKRGPKGSSRSGFSGNHSLGNGCHRGLGYLLDRRGDDRYSASSLGGGTAWDIGMGYLLDLDGDDQITDLHGVGYYGHMGKGAAKGFALAFHYEGKDIYQRRSLGNSVHIAERYSGKGGNFSFFIDVGPEKDIYLDAKKYKNDEVSFGQVVIKKVDDEKDPQGIGLFLDGLRVLESSK